MSNPLTTLYVGIDVSKDSNEVCCLSFEGKNYFQDRLRTTMMNLKTYKVKLLRFRRITHSI